MEQYKPRKTVRGPVPRCQYENDGQQCERAVYFKGRCFWHQPEATEQMSAIGKRGGAAGTGKAKRRTREQYREMARKSAEVRRAKKSAAAHVHKPARFTKHERAGT